MGWCTRPKASINKTKLGSTTIGHVLNRPSLGQMSSNLAWWMPYIGDVCFTFPSSPK
jgi:hypothetical protein